jgi:hypothetical protein
MVQVRVADGSISVFELKIDFRDRATAQHPWQPRFGAGGRAS